MNLSFYSFADGLWPTYSASLSSMSDLPVDEVNSSGLENNPKHILYPPGGILIWALVVLELITFGAGLLALAVYSRQDPEGFHEMSSLLNSNYGVLNTLFLLSSGYFMAASLSQFKLGDRLRSSRLLALAFLGGLLFLGLKGVEYSEKLSHSFTLGYNTFFNFYWLLTGFHLMHVLVGMVIILFMYFRIRPSGSNMKVEDAEAGAAFWHMCDLIWLILFPALYLIF